MADLLEFLDSVSIDVVKRKYYNANKVNAVFEELREKASELEAENERLRQELTASSQEQASVNSSLHSLQNAYREALQSAHTRADEMIAKAERESGALLKKAEQRSELAARQVEECLNTVRIRQEQNAEFLQSELQRFLAALQDEDSGVEFTAPDARGGSASFLPELTESEQNLRSKVSALSSEIQALEHKY